MKIISLAFIATFIVASASAQLENTRWKTILEVNGPINTLIDFRKDTVLIYTVADSTLIERMTYKSDDTSFTLQKIDGQSDCDNTPGKYSYTINEDNLRLSLLSDDCYDRYSVIQNTRWKKWRDHTGIKVDEAILKQYTGIYGLDNAHPIIITLDREVLYAEGPHNGLPKSPLTPMTASKFFLRIAGVEMDFVKDASGNVVKIISHEKEDYELKKIK
jgi:hypothetical protein